MNLAKVMMSVLAAVGVSALAGAAEVPRVVRVEFQTSYIPNGFDTNDKVQIVGEGIFPNSCYRKAGVRVSVNQTLKQIRVTPTAYQYDGMCMQMIVPFDSVVDVGLLRAGTYKVINGTTNEEVGDLNVRVATNSGPDDYLYAPVSQAYTRQLGESLQVSVSGEFSNSCMKLVDVLTNVQDKVIVVQPIAQLSDEPNCAQGIFPFERTITLTGVKEGRYLLHVRSLNGNAINSLFNVGQ